MEPFLAKTFQIPLCSSLCDSAAAADDHDDAFASSNVCECVSDHGIDLLYLNRDLSQTSEACHGITAHIRTKHNNTVSCSCFLSLLKTFLPCGVTVQ